MANTKFYRVHTASSFSQLSYADQLMSIEGIQSLASTLETFKLLSYTMPLSMEGWRDERSRLAQSVANIPWRSNGFQQELRLGDKIANEIKLQSLQHYLVLENWKGDGRELGNWGLVATPAYPPSPLVGEYASHVRYLYPTNERGDYDKTRPYARIISSASLKDSWTWQYPIGNLLREASGSMVVAMHAQRVSQRKVEFFANTLQANTTDISRVSDRDVLVRLQDAESILMSITRGMAVHNVRFFFMVMDYSKDRLNKRVDSLATKLSAHMGVDHLIGYQAEASQAFSPSLNAVGLPDTSHNVTSPGTGIMLGSTGYFTREKYKGIYLGVSRGIEGEILGLEYFAPWQGQKAAHKLILGETGSGKTVFMNSLMVREAEQGAQVINLEPQGHSKRLLSYLGPELTSYNELSYETVRYNPMDLQFVNLSEQTDYLLILLEMLLNPRGDDPDRPRRYLTNQEIASVQEAIRKTYDGYDLEALVSGKTLAPRLDDFVYWLKNSRGGDDLADELKRMYVEGPWADNFNTDTNLDVRLRRQDGSLWPCVVYNLHGIPQTRRNLFYFLILAAIGRESRKALPPGVERPRRAVFVDEFRYLSSGSNTLVNWVADQVATSRTYRVAYTLADQNPVTFMGLGAADGFQSVGDASEMAGRLHMLENMSYLFSFRLKETGAQRLRGLFPQLTDSHAAWLSRAAGTGQTLFLNDNNEISLIDVALRASEIKHFTGS